MLKHAYMLVHTLLFTDKQCCSDEACIHVIAHVVTYRQSELTSLNLQTKKVLQC